MYGSPKNRLRSLAIRSWPLLGKKKPPVVRRGQFAAELVDEDSG
jgi:hypothetical protein